MYLPTPPSWPQKKLFSFTNTFYLVVPIFIYFLQYSRYVLEDSLPFIHCMSTSEIFVSPSNKQYLKKEMKVTCLNFHTVMKGDFTLCGRHTVQYIDGIS